MATFYWYGNSGLWSDYVSHWSGNSNNTPAAPKTNAPTAADDVIFDAASISSPGQTITLDVSCNCKSLNTVNIANNPNFYLTVGPWYFWGDVTMGTATMTKSAGRHDIQVRASSLFTCNNFIFSCTYFILYNPAVMTLGSSFQLLGCQLFQENGPTFNTNNYSLNISSGVQPDDGIMNLSANTILNLGSSIYNIVGWYAGYGAGTVNTGTSSIRMSGSNNFYGGNRVYYEVQLNGTSHIITGSNAITNLLLPPATTQTITLTSGTTQTISTLARLSGDSTHRHTLRSSVAGQAASLAKSGGGSILVDFCDLIDIQGNGNCYYGRNCTLSGNTAGWKPYSVYLYL